MKAPLLIKPMIMRILLKFYRDAAEKTHSENQ
jgi:hypothetical protein